MDSEIKTKPPGSSSFPAAETNTKTNNCCHLAEDSEDRKLEQWSVVFEFGGEILISYSPLEQEGWPKRLGIFGVLPDGEIFINPAILCPWARLSAVISGIAIALKDKDVPILVPLSWAKNNYPQSVEMLNDIEVFVRATSVEIEEGKSHGG